MSPVFNPRDMEMETNKKQENIIYLENNNEELKYFYVFLLENLANLEILLQNLAFVISVVVVVFYY